jgi:tRNA pseudouridine55 synthase
MNGIILVNKPIGFSSHDVVNIIKRTLKVKVGHTGTLDPQATGLLIMCIGKATKLSNEFLSKSKSYIAKINFGYETTTLDSEGEVVFSNNSIIDKAKIIQEVSNLVNVKEQIPPNFSAIKINGVPAYKKAVRQEIFEIKKREISINKAEVIEIGENSVTLFLDVSKGTYIRSIARDLGRSLESYGTLVSLNRVSIDKYNLNESYTLKQIENMYNVGDASFIIPIEQIYSSAPNLILDNINYFKYLNGQLIKINNSNGIYKIFVEQKFMGLGKIEDNILKSYKIFM